MGKILGIDCGDKRIGLALSDAEQKYAFAFEVIESQGNQEVFYHLKEIVKKEDIVKIVVGLPLNMNGQDTNQTRIVRQFSKKIKEKIGLGIEFIDERLTSKMVDDIFKRSETKIKKRKKKRDSIAAALILQTYLDKSKV